MKHSLKELETKYKALEKEYMSLGGGSWQFADSEQNLTPNERKARDLADEMRRIGHKIAHAKKLQNEEATVDKRMQEGKKEAEETLLQSLIGMTQWGISESTSINEMHERTTAENLNVGDVVEITGNVMHHGKTGEIDSFGEGKKFVVVNLYNAGKHSFHSSDVSEADLSHEEEDEDEDDTFYVAFHDEDEGHSWIGEVSKRDDTKWRERALKGKPDYRWGTSYMGYLSPEQVMTWIRKDYSRGMEIEGPFFDSQEAIDFVKNNWGRIDEEAYTQVATTWAVKPKNPKHFMKWFPLKQEEQAKRFAQSTGGKLILVDQFGREIKTQKLR